MIAHHLFLLSVANCLLKVLSCCKFAVGELTALLGEEQTILPFGSKFVNWLKAYQLTHVIFLVCCGQSVLEYQCMVVGASPLCA